jgi:hypothetical protein
MTDARKSIEANATANMALMRSELILKNLLVAKIAGRLP